MSIHETFEKFLERTLEISDIGGAIALMSWDQETYMPAGGQPARARQMAALQAISHNKFTSAEMGDLIAELRENADALDGIDQRIMVERVAWDYDRATKIPEALVRETATAQSNSVAAWSEARPKNDFEAFRPHLEKLLELTRQRADCLKAEGQARYDALLDDYERGTTAKHIEEVFTPLRDAVSDLVARIAEKGDAVDDACLTQEFPTCAQWNFGVEVLGAMGFDMTTGRQDKSAHPFTTSFHPTDVRLTTRVTPNDLRMALFGTMHEGGHGLYDQGFAPEDYDTPLASSISLGIHESQSRMWENLVGRSRPFWRHFYPRLQGVFPQQLGGVVLDDFYRSVNRVQPSLIRVEADEVTYSLHIILRFELERAMLEGDLAPTDLPTVWRERFREYLGVEVPDDRDGCMQDIHWAWGLIGYFPTYTLGNIYSVQFFNQARKDIGDLDERIAAGELTALTEWLREKVHRVGQRRLAEELCTDITGGPLDSGPYVAYLEEKFGEVYGL